ncbi:MAG TPA: hypothetical protein VHR18_08635 [Solirubrobacterales bacterium]|jgi:hypothetical protein|nr:hypothetical protein [Solirubrobacterales bacterium]
MALLLLAGCGGGSSASDTRSSQEQIEQARHEGAVAAHRRERVAALQRRVARLERRSRAGSAATVQAQQPTPTAPATTEDVAEPSQRYFHTPSGNVSCTVSPGGATCVVSSTGQGFVLETGNGAWVEAGSSVPSGTGELVPYGSTISADPISCSVPASDEARGVVCTDASTGHGFEASRVESRQRTF